MGRSIGSLELCLGGFFEGGFNLWVGWFIGLVGWNGGIWLVEVFQFQWGKRPYRHVRGC